MTPLVGLAGPASVAYAGVSTFRNLGEIYFDYSTTPTQKLMLGAYEIGGSAVTLGVSAAGAFLGELATLGNPLGAVVGGASFGTAADVTKNYYGRNILQYFRDENLGINKIDKN